MIRYAKPPPLATSVGKRQILPKPTALPNQQQFQNTNSDVVVCSLSPNKQNEANTTDKEARSADQEVEQNSENNQYKLDYNHNRKTIDKDNGERIVEDSNQEVIDEDDTIDEDFSAFLDDLLNEANTTDKQTEDQEVVYLNGTNQITTTYHDETFEDDERINPIYADCFFGQT